METFSSKKRGKGIKAIKDGIFTSALWGLAVTIEVISLKSLKVCIIFDYKKSLCKFVSLLFQTTN